MAKNDNWINYLKSLKTEELSIMLTHRYDQNHKEKIEVDGLTKLFAIISFSIVGLVTLLAWPLSLMFGTTIWLVALIVASLPAAFGILLTVSLLKEASSSKNKTKDMKKVLLSRI